MKVQRIDNFVALPALDVRAVSVLLPQDTHMEFEFINARRNQPIDERVFAEPRQEPLP